MQTKTCPSCSGDGQLLGALGRTRHYRCRHCGWTFHHTPRVRKPKTKSTTGSTS
jgi:tRNA(Ile2) C34 agmatinyltransferase TiaS